MDNAFVKPGRDVLAYFGSNEDVGQSDQQVKKAQEKYGFNGEAAANAGSKRVRPNCRTLKLTKS